MTQGTKVLRPSYLEKRRARNGYYGTFAEMPRLVREWARSVGCRETEAGVYGPVEGGGYIDQLVRESLSASNGRKRRWR